MANGVPYAIAAQIAYPDRQSIAFVGDGGFSMLMAEFITAVKYQLPIKVVILKNNTLGMIKMEQMLMLGNPEYGCELEPIDFAAFARACGATGFRIEDPATCGEILDQALATPGPVLVEAITDPNELPMPPQLKAEEIANISEALSKGQADAAKIARVVAKSKVRQMI
jgi:pyruvate dehydrogenase (quinone)/pyruvate oxidase